ncbi:Predicted ATPase [Leclercia adecarboxylata]|uniref:Predicted ATPase n=1 Tax=Leclercia adecarboxylata TaxID=83655 RepID=A0A4V6JHB6_9ENTR|nr:Predicted ATPase [Leclercia adecarboxylata]
MPPFSFVLLTRIVGAPIACIQSFLDLAIRISLPLRLMHLRNLVHGDIKPGNIFIHDDNSCRLGGFGLSSGTSQELQQARLASHRRHAGLYVAGTPTRTQRAVDSAAISTAWALCFTTAHRQPAV